MRSAFTLRRLHPISARSPTLTILPRQFHVFASSSPKTTQSTVVPGLTFKRSLRSSSIKPANMSYSNTDTGDKPADPYKQKNMDSPELKEKIEDLTNFISACKFGMMTTRVESSGLLVSRCMAVAAKVGRVSSHLLPTLQRMRDHPRLNDIYDTC